jgi:hypothetical protein
MSTRSPAEHAIPRSLMLVALCVAVVVCVLPHLALFTDAEIWLLALAGLISGALAAYGIMERLHS